MTVQKQQKQHWRGREFVSNDQVVSRSCVPNMNVLQWMIRYRTSHPIQGFPCYIKGCSFVAEGKTGNKSLECHLMNKHNHTPYPYYTQYFSDLVGFKHRYKWTSAFKPQESHLYNMHQKLDFEIHPCSNSFHTAFHFQVAIQCLQVREGIDIIYCSLDLNYK
jgi:hypothetical protein